MTMSVYDEWGLGMGLICCQLGPQPRLIKTVPLVKVGYGVHISRWCPSSPKPLPRRRMSHMDLLHQFRDLNQSSPEFPNQLTSLLLERGFKDRVGSLQDNDSAWLVEYLDNVRTPVILTDSPPKLVQALNILYPASPISFRKCLHELRAICGSRKILPQSCMFPGSPPSTVGWPIASKGSCDMYEGSIDDSKVCVVRLRVYSNGGPETAKSVCDRRHYLSTFTSDETHRPSSSKPWCGNGWSIRTLSHS